MVEKIAATILFIVLVTDMSLWRLQRLAQSKAKVLFLPGSSDMSLSKCSLEELDSYLYQTVGQDAIKFVAQALDVPLFRRVIVGTAVEQGAEYGGRNASDPPVNKDDETEDLYALLAQVKVKSACPIINTYNRTIDRVASCSQNIQTSKVYP